MASLNKNILLISYTFPPYPGIGGRRWAKFAKYLSRLGYVVHVVHCKNPLSENSLWMEDVSDSYQIKRYEIEDTYPTVLLSQPKFFMEKIKYKLALLRVKLFSRGTPYDRSIFSKKEFFKKSESLINQYDIKNVIVSCAPFGLAYSLLELKKKINGLNLLVDFRDPWTWGDGYGFANLTGSRLVFEKEKEKLVLENFNTVFVPNEEMKSHLADTYLSQKNRIHLLPHGFDKDEIKRGSKQKSPNLRMMLYGSLYANLESVFEELASFISINEHLYLDIFSSSKQYLNIFESHVKIKSRVNYKAPLRPKELFSEMSNYDCVLIVQPDYAKDFVTTKIYEIIYAEMPIVLISKEGKLSDFIQKNELGMYINPAHLSEGLDKILDLDKVHFNAKEFPIEPYSFEHITKNLNTFFV